MFKQTAAIGTIAVALTILFTLWPVAVQATDPTNVQVKVDGVLHYALENPACVAQVQGCGLAGIEAPYLTTLDGVNYQLLGVQLSYFEGTKLVVTGWLQAPSGSGVLSPALIVAGAITVTSFYAHCVKHLS